MHRSRNFELKATLHYDPALLSLELKDLENGVMFAGEYREQDGEISGMVELEDIFLAFKKEESDASKERRLV